ncbi:hypothetical protein CJ030_MR7G027950 [Morella rubra]|uniref:Uncharacterized protein n=1 Tax=Morella rubra TaxID=262757 RepID=A0A6A1UZP9_9ROSI|nr:hypothetical protein CJ030_MR7G027950 [Morella rubra]
MFGRLSNRANVVRTDIQPSELCRTVIQSCCSDSVYRCSEFWFGRISNRANAFCADSEKMSKRARTSSQADDEQSSARTLTVEQHTTIIMSRSIVVERDIKLADFNDLTFEGRTLPEVVEGLGWLPLIHRTGYASKNMVREFYCSILRARDLEEPSMELTVRNVPIIFSPDELANFLGYERDLTAFPNLPMSEEGRPTKAEVFRTMLGDDTTILEGSFMFLHAMMVPESGDEPRALPLGSINKTTLSKSIAQTRRALQAARVARVRRQEQPEEAMEGEDPGQSSTQGLGAQRPSWMDSMMTELSQRMESVLQPTHCMVSDISRRLTALEQKVADMDVGWKKEVAA